MSLIKGENVMLYAFDGMMKPIVCGLTCSITTNAGSIGTSISGSGAWETFEYTSLSWRGTFEGLIYLQMDNSLALPDVRAMQIARQKLLVRYTRTDNDGNVYTDEGIALIESISDSGPNEAMSSFSLELKGTGPLTQVFVPTPINPFGKVKILEHTATGTETTYSNALLIGKDVINIFIDGDARSKIITAGTPLNQEAKYVTATGIITYAQPILPDTEVRIEYQDI